MKRYRERNLQLLIATDVAARGIDVNDVTHVINYSLPDEVENYTHRSGRTARAGKTGISIALVNGKEMSKIRHIEKIIGKQFVRKAIPQGTEVCEKQLFSIVNNVHNVEVQEEQINAFLPQILESLQDLSKEEVIKRFASLEFNRFLEYYRNAPDLNVEARETRGERGRDGFGSSSRDRSNGYTRLFINLGSVDDFSRGDMLGFICNQGKISGKSVGKIDLKGVFTFFEVTDDVVDNVFQAFKEVDFNGRSVRIEVSGDGKSSDRGGRRRSGDRRDRGSSRSGGGGHRDRSGGGFRDYSGKRRESKSRY